MALIKCPECTKEVSSKADACPFCGYPIAKQLNKAGSEQQDVLSPVQDAVSTAEQEQIQHEQIQQDGSEENVKVTIPAPEHQEAAHKYRHHEAVHKHKKQEVVHKHTHHETIRKLEQRRAEELEVEYACLKILFAILESEEFKNVDYMSISYLDDTDENEIVILSDKYKTNKIIRKSDFLTSFNFSPGAFVYFLHTNGAINERISKDKKAPVGYYREETKESTIPRVGAYYLDALTGFWKKASAEDIELLEKERKDALYMRCDQSSK